MNRKADHDAMVVRAAQQDLRRELYGYWRGDWIYAVRQVQKLQALTSHLSKLRLEAPLKDGSLWHYRLQTQLMWHEPIGIEGTFLCPLCKEGLPRHARRASEIHTRRHLEKESHLGWAGDEAPAWNIWAEELRYGTWDGACELWAGDLTLTGEARARLVGEMLNDGLRLIPRIDKPALRYLDLDIQNLMDRATEEKKQRDRNNPWHPSTVDSALAP